MSKAFHKISVVLAIALLSTLTVPYLPLGEGDSPAGSKFVKIRVLNWEDFDRVDAPVTLGVPFPIGDLPSVDNVKLLDEDFREVPAQFKPLAFWPDGSIMWLLVDFTCFVKGGGEAIFYLEYGEEVERTDFGSSLSIVDVGDAIYVYTGSMNLTIDKTAGVFRNIYIDSDEDGRLDLLAARELYFNVQDVNGILYSSKLAKPSVEVESRGPLRAVVKIRGAHVSSTEDYLLNYTLRAYFYAGKSYFKIFYTEENDLPCLNDGSGQPNCLRLGSPNSVYFEDLSLIILLSEPLNRYLGDGLAGNFENSVLVYQDSSGGEDWNRWPGVTFRGYKFYVDGIEERNGNRFRGWMDIQGSKLGVGVGVRYFWQNYPKAIEATGNGEVYVRLMPKYFSQPFEHRAGEHKTHEVIVYFHGAQESSDKTRQTLESLLNPLYARAPAEWYMYSGVFDYFEPYNPEGFEYYEVNNLAAVKNGTGGYYGDNLFDIRENVDFYGWMHFGDVRVVDEDGGTGQMNLQYDFGYGMLVQSLRLFGGDDLHSYLWWQLAEQAIRHEADIDILHVHDGDPSQPSSYWIKWCWGGMFPHTPHEYDGRENPHRGSSPHLEFQWNRGLIYYYYMTGYEKALDSALEVSENTYWRVVNGPGEPGYSGTTSDEARAPANALDILINAYYLTGDPKYLEAAAKVVEESHFNNKWYKDGPNPEYSDRTVAPWQIALLMISLGRYLDTIRLVEGRIDSNALSSLIGYADWMLKYCYHPEGDEASSYPHFIYRWRGDGTQIDWSPGGGANSWQVKIADAYAYAWIYTGNETYLKIAEEQFRIGSENFWYEGNPVGSFATGKVHSILSTGGSVFTGVYVGDAPRLFCSLISFKAVVEDVSVVRGIVRLNITLSMNGSGYISAVEYGIGNSNYSAKPVDGVYNSTVETVHIELNGTSYEDGEYTLWVKARTSNGCESPEFNYTLKVRTLKPRYNLIALTLQPLKPINASDLATAVGQALLGIWKWNPELQEYEGYTPGVSEPSDDFPLEVGYGYFVYLAEPAKLVEIGKADS